MTTATIKIRNYRSAVNIIDNSNLEKKIFRILMVSFGALALFYFVILSSMVYNIVERKSLEEQARAMSNEVSGLELTYLSESSKIDLDFARTLGYRETAKVYANSNANTDAVALLNN